MNTHLKDLIALSHNDLAIASFTPQIELGDKKLARIQVKLDRVQNELNGLNAEIEKNETQVAIFEDKIVTSNVQLKDNDKKSKNISTEKEMKALSVERSVAEENIKYANDEIIRLQGITAIKKELHKEATDKLAALTHEITAMHEIVDVERAEIEESKKELFVQREGLMLNLEQKVLAFYEKIRIWAGNTAVVPVKKQACYGCYMKLNDKTYSEVIKADEICNCPHCGRILYIDFETPVA